MSKTMRIGTKTVSSMWIFTSCILPMVQNGDDAASAAANPTQVSIGENYSFSIARALGSSNFSNNSLNCDATSYSMTITSETDEEIYNRADSFLTEKCISEPSDWKDILIWDKTQCEVNFTSCSLFEDEYLAAAGDYTITFNLAIGFDGANNLSNSFNVEVLPTYLYKILTDDSRIYPHIDGFKDSLTGNVSFWNETGETIPVSGVEVALKSGSKVIKSSSVKASGEFRLTPQEDLLGAFTLVASKLPNASGGRKWVELSEPSEIKLYPTQLTEVTLTVPAEIYPQKDNYLDVGYIGFNALSNSDSEVKVTGTVVIKRGNVTVKTFEVKKSGYSQFKWDGRDNGEIISGYYSVQAKVTGPQGRSKIAKRTIKIVNKKWVTTTLSKTYDAGVATDESLGDSWFAINRNTDSVRFYSSGDGDTMIVKLSVPINSSTVKWRIKFNNWSTTGATFSYFPCQNSDCLYSYESSLVKVFPSWDEGTETWTKWAYISGTYANFIIGSTDYGSITVDSFTVEYVLRKLK